jgi:hypothetical protein
VQQQGKAAFEGGLASFGEMRPRAQWRRSDWSMGSRSRKWRPGWASQVSVAQGNEGGPLPIRARAGSWPLHGAVRGIDDDAGSLRRPPVALLCSVCKQRPSTHRKLCERDNGGTGPQSKSNMRAVGVAEGAGSVRHACDGSFST